ncbi:hypothetical protein KGY79_08510 [Candidatus Bipolaricaulota bacterium]|nr:hypothetical protein [Candidatus Bipolaricaulota bacterium]
MSKIEEPGPKTNPIFSLRNNILLFIGLIAVGSLVVPFLHVQARIEGEVDTELWLAPRESLLGEKSVTNFRVDYLKGNLTNYPNRLATALYWPNTNNTLFDTGLALSGALETPLIEGTSGSSTLNLTLDGYFAQNFGPDYPIGTAGGSSRVYFGEDDWRLRASDYALSAEAEYSYAGRSFVFGETDYEGALSLEGGGGNLELAVDSYWSSDPDLFGISKLTGEARYRLSNSFELITGLVLNADKGLQDLILNTIYKW